jgi:hypothetical protein
MLMRNSNTGAFEVYDISNNAVTSAASMGQVSLEWQVGSIANDPPAASLRRFDHSASCRRWRRSRRTAHPPRAEPSLALTVNSRN